jgi:Uma2 family endonuclease
MGPITDFAALDLSRTYSYADYSRWQFEEKVELIKGRIFRMSPAPNVKHQHVVWKLGGVFFNYFNNAPCRVFPAPFDVRLYDSGKSQRAAQDVFTVVQPDLCVICDRAKLDEQGCNGAPDLVVEILSKGNTTKEMKLKYALYEESGVREYWVIYPYEENLLRFALNAQGRYELQGVYVTDDTVTTGLFPGLAVDLADVFAE